MRTASYNLLLLFILLYSGKLHAQVEAPATDTLRLPASTEIIDLEAETNTAYVVDSTRKHTIYVVNDSLSYLYYRPKWHEFITNIPGDFASAGKTLVSKDAVKPLLAIAGSTAVLYAADRWLVDEVQRISSNIGLANNNRFKPAIRIGSSSLMQYPGNLNTGFYFIGEGWTSVLIFTGIATHGVVTGNQKEIRMFSQFFEGYLAMGITVQVLKRSFGRETPGNATSPRGTFRPFPSFRSYQSHVSKYDAMPSGHMATMMYTVTLLAESYPDSRLIRPIGYSLMGICGFAMLNNGVHWASDYPLGIGIGFLFAKIAAKQGRVAIHTGGKQKLTERLRLSPTMFADGLMGLSLRVDMSPFNRPLR